MSHREYYDKKAELGRKHNAIVVSSPPGSEASSGSYASPEESRLIAEPSKSRSMKQATGRALPLRNRSLGKIGTTPTEPKFTGIPTTTVEASPVRVNDEMSKPVLFYGKPNQLDDVLTYIHVKNLVDQNTTNEETSASLASTFRGAALQWPTQQLRDNPDLSYP
jgi:hypothetical protein